MRHPRRMKGLVGAAAETEIITEYSYMNFFG
jgi:hypothetical protein